MPDNLAFLFAAFAVVWLLIFGYLLFIGGRIGSLRQDVEALRDELDARTPPDASDGAGEATPHSPAPGERPAGLAEMRRE